MVSQSQLKDRHVRQLSPQLERAKVYQVLSQVFRSLSAGLGGSPGKELQEVAVDV